MLCGRVLISPEEEMALRCWARLVKINNLNSIKLCYVLGLRYLYIIKICQYIFIVFRDWMTSRKVDLIETA